MGKGDGFLALLGEIETKDSSFEWSNGIFSQNGFLKRSFGDKGKEYSVLSFEEHFLVVIRILK
jgi:hypothetical protein